MRLPAVVVGCVSVSLLGALLWALAPAIDFDALLYHLSVPAFYVQQHGLVEVAERYQSYWAHNVEMLYTLALLLADQPLPTLINWTIGLLTAGLVFALGRRVGGARTGMAAVLLFCSTPIVARECGIAVNDMGVSLFSFGAVYCAAAWWQEKDDRWLIFVGLLAGLAVGTKLSATLMLVPLFLCLALGLLLRHGPSKRAAVGLVHVALPAAALVAPWLVRDWLWTGNPIFPFRNTLFRSPQWPVENVYHVGLRSDSSELLGSVRSPPDLLGQLLAFVRLAWYLVRQPGMFSEWVPPGFMGGLPVLALPWVGLGQRQPSPKRRLLLYAMFSLAVVVTLLWWQVLRYLRHLLQLLPLLAVLAAMNLEALWLGLRNSRWGRGAATLGLLLALCYVAATRVIETVSNWQLLERYPYRLLLGLETRERFLSRTLPAYDALQFLNRTGDGEHKVLSIDSSCWLYTMSRVYAPGGSPEIDRILYSLPPGPDLAQALEQEGFEFLLVDRFHTRADPQRYQLAVLDEAFIQEFARLEFARHNMYVYRFDFSDSAAVSRGGQTLLTNGGFETTDADGDLSGWSVYGSTTVDCTGAEAHSGKVGVQMDADSRAFQDVPIESGQLYTLGHWSRADRADQMAWLHVNWLDAQKQLLDVSIDVVPVSYDWQWQQMSVTAPDDARFAQVYLSVDAKSEVWFDDVVLVEGTP